jgi:protein gp37
MDNTRIEWTDATWNPIRGCTRVSQGCVNCYAESVAARFSDPGMPYEGLAKRTSAGPRWTGEIAFVEKALDQPLRWRKPRRIFVNSMSDLFHEKVEDEWLDRIFAVMLLAPQHTFQVLTKRPERMRDYMRGLLRSGRWLMWKHPTQDHDIFDPVIAKLHVMARHIWLGTSVEDQDAADERVPLLVETPCAVRFISAEPLLAHVDLSPWLPWLQWVIVGGESGPRARPMNPQWTRDLREQCEIARVPFFFKQWGEFVSVSEVAGPGEHYSFPDGRTVRRTGKKLAGRTLDGRLWDEMPAT